MSFDRRIDNLCTHQAVDEALFFSADRLTVTPLRPIANSNSVQMRINGVADLPQVGVQTFAVGKGSLPGPYNIQAGVNDLLVVAVDNKTVQTIQLSAGRGLSAQKIADDLNRKVSGVYFSVTKKNQVQASSYTRGRFAKLMFKAGSTVSTTLGLTLNRAYFGQQVYPSWSLVLDPNTLTDRPSRLVLFDEPILGTNDYVELSYVTPREECRRCGGSGVENDWRYDGSGALVTVQNSDLLIQEVLKITYTVKGSNPFHVWYGTGLLDAIGKKLTSGGFVQNLILSEVQNAFKRWQSIKRQQEEKVGQEVTDEEYPFRLMVVNLETDDNDPTIIYVNAWVQNRSASPIQITRGLQLPIPTDLLGSTVQDALLQQVQAQGRESFLG